MTVGWFLPRASSRAIRPRSRAGGPFVTRWTVWGGAPLAAGALADTSGYIAVFAVAAAGIVAAVIVAGVAEPRTRGA